MPELVELLVLRDVLKKQLQLESRIWIIDYAAGLLSSPVTATTPPANNLVVTLHRIEVYGKQLLLLTRHHGVITIHFMLCGRLRSSSSTTSAAAAADVNLMSIHLSSSSPTNNNKNNNRENRIWTVEDHMGLAKIQWYQSLTHVAAQTAVPYLVGYKRPDMNWTDWTVFRDAIKKKSIKTVLTDQKLIWSGIGSRICALWIEVYGHELQPTDKASTIKKDIFERTNVIVRERLELCRQARMAELSHNDVLSIDPAIALVEIPLTILETNN